MILLIVVDAGGLGELASSRGRSAVPAVAHLVSRDELWHGIVTRIETHHWTRDRHATISRSHDDDEVSRVRRRDQAGQDEPKISQERLAEIVGTSRRHMIRLENGENRPAIT